MNNLLLDTLIEWHLGNELAQGSFAGSTSLSLYQCANYRAVINWLKYQRKVYKIDVAMVNIKDVRAYLESFYHLCEAEDFERASNVFLSPMQRLNGEKLYELLGRWGNYQQMIDCSNKLLEKPHLEVDLVCLKILGNAYYNLNNYLNAGKYNRQVLQIAQQKNDLEQVAEAFVILASTERAQGNYTQALEYFESALQIACQLENRKMQGRIIQGLGLTYHNLGKEDESLECHQNALDIAREVGDRYWEGITLTDMSLCYLSIKFYDQALEVNSQGLEIAIQVGNRAGQGWCKCNKGKILLEVTQYSEAEDNLREALTIFGEIRKPFAEKHICEVLASLYFKMDQRELSHQYSRRVLTISEDLGVPLSEECKRMLALEE
jgi:tetratricopeptide (TPR) repeat protein